MRIFTPEFVFKNITRITPSFLHKQGIKGLVLDVDNTLTGHGSQELTPQIERWLQAMRKTGIRLMIASNNYENRVAPFAGKLGLDYVSFCCKPSPRWLIAAKQKWGLPTHAIALVGDQIFTDGLGGHLYGARVLLVRPQWKDIKPGIRFKRKLESPVLLRYYKRGGRLL